MKIKYLCDGSDDDKNIPPMSLYKDTHYKKYHENNEFPQDISTERLR